MSILSSIFTGVSGLNSNGQELSVIGDNIANVNTVGYKGSTMNFGDILSQTLTGLSGTSQVGRGVDVNGVTPVFSQGTFQTTSSSLDLAIDGDGFFMVKNNGATEYTRAGNFQLDQSGNITTPTGAVLQGYLADATGTVSGQIANLKVLATQSAALATSNGTVVVNLNAGDTLPSAAWVSPPVGSTTAPASNTYNYSTSDTVYDSLGTAHQVSVYFEKTAPGWTAHYVYQDPPIAPATVGVYHEAGTQALTFQPNGTLATGASSAALAFPWTNGSTAGSITFNLTGTTQYGSDYAITSIGQNGYASGTMSNLTIDDKGVVTGTFTNGQTRTLAQVCLAKFEAPTELSKLGDNMYAQSSSSGQPIVGDPQTSGLGRTLSNTLEMSNVDLATEFTNLISAQRGFEANTKIITTTDQMLNELISIKQ